MMMPMTCCIRLDFDFDPRMESAPHVELKSLSVGFEDTPVHWRRWAGPGRFPPIGCFRPEGPAALFRDHRRNPRKVLGISGIPREAVPSFLQVDRHGRVGDA